MSCHSKLPALIAGHLWGEWSHLWPVAPITKSAVTWKVFLCDDIIMRQKYYRSTINMIAETFVMYISDVIICLPWSIGKSATANVIPVTFFPVPFFQFPPHCYFFPVTFFPVTFLLVQNCYFFPVSLSPSTLVPFFLLLFSYPKLLLFFLLPIFLLLSFQSPFSMNNLNVDIYIVGNSHRSAGLRPTILEEDRELFVNFSLILCLWFEIQGKRTYNFFDWLSNTGHIQFCYIENKYLQGF